MFEVEYKIILLGDLGSGKTSFFKKINIDIFINANYRTILLNEKRLNLKLEINKNETIESKDFKMNLHDTGGQEKYLAISSLYYKGVNGVLLIYDITNRASFDSLQIWKDSIKEHCGEFDKYAFVLIGNKLDLIEENNQKRAVTEEEAQEFCNKNEILWGGEISIKNIKGNEFKELFEEYIKKIYEKVGGVKVIKKTIELTKPRRRHAMNKLFC